MKTNLIVAACQPSNGIGIKGSLPWKLKEDMKYFRTKTLETSDPKLRNAVVMGRKTWESIPVKFKPLKDRLNVVLTRQDDFVVENPDVLVKHSLEDALKELKSTNNIENCWIIGGTSVYEKALDKVQRIYFTEIDRDFECDAFFPKIDLQLFREISSGETITEGDLAYRFKIFERR